VICESISNLCNIINYLIAWLGVLVDGRVKPGHDRKPKVARYGATSNGERYMSRILLFGFAVTH
jgi:hypothetical protein